MGDYDRRLFRANSSNKEGFVYCEAQVHGNIKIDKGDLLFLDIVNNLRNRGNSTADWYIYPFSKVSGSTLTLASNRSFAQDNFLGTAAWHSDSGVTESIIIWTHGIFKYPLKNSRYIKNNQYTIPAGSGVTLYNQKVAISSSTSETDYIGRVANNGKFQSSVQMLIWSQIFQGHVKVIP